MTNSVEVAEINDDAEACDYYVCVRVSVPSRFDDDVYDFCVECVECGEKVRHRLHGPKTPKKVCYECNSAGRRGNDVHSDRCRTGRIVAACA